MSQCQLIQTGEKHRTGREIVRCGECAAWGLMPPDGKLESLKLSCRNAVQPALSAAEVSELFPNEDPTLLGNRIKAMTEAIGIPACGGCETRREWINRAHQWVRSAIGTHP